MNKFISKTMQSSSVVKSENNAKKYSTSQNGFVDQFSTLGNFKAVRNFSDIEKDFNLLWSQDKDLAVRFALYMRTITRVVSDFDGNKTAESQKGAGLKNEAIQRFYILAKESPKTFQENLQLLITLGSWKDFFELLRTDLSNGWENRKLNWKFMGDFLLSSLKNERQFNLIAKYLPSVKSSAKVKTKRATTKNVIAKWISSLLFDNDTYSQYRKLKSSGNAHTWQQLISKRKFNEIDFSKIHGRALNILTKGRFLKNQGLEERYAEWIAKPDTENVKYTGFVHELFYDIPFNKFSLDTFRVDTINKQFKTLVDKGGSKTETKLIVVRDTSGSMGSLATGTKMSCFDIGKALALYFSEFLEGEFKDHYIEFNSNAKMVKWVGNTPVDRWYNDRSRYVGSTNFQSVIDLLVEMKNKGVNEKHFPTGILCISDSEFNPSSLSNTNVEDARRKLQKAGFSKKYCKNFVIVLWNLQSYSRGNKFETSSLAKNTFYFSGYEPSVISFLDDIKNSDELFLSAMNQEILNLVKVF